LAPAHAAAEPDENDVGTSIGPAVGGRRPVGGGRRVVADPNVLVTVQGHARREEPPGGARLAKETAADGGARHGGYTFQIGTVALPGEEVESFSSISF